MNFFDQSFQTLNNIPTIPPAQATAILGIMQTEIDAAQMALQKGEDASTAYDNLGDSLSAQWNVATGGGSVVSDWYPLGRYLLLAQTNFDHFSQDAVIAYTAGHAVALEMAVAASQRAGNAAQNAALQVAYAANAFADHFLSDLFSSGHMRAPRKQLYRGVTPSDLGSLLARAMHDEDSHFGLMVTPADGGAPWRAYGDKRYFDSVDLTNLNLVDGAVQISADEVS